MSLPEQEARSLGEAFQFLLDLSSGAEKRIPAATRQRARAIAKHFPLAAGERWQRRAARCIAPEATRDLCASLTEQVPEVKCPCRHGGSDDS